MTTRRAKVARLVVRVLVLLLVAAMASVIVESAHGEWSPDVGAAARRVLSETGQVLSRESITP